MFDQTRLASTEFYSHRFKNFSTMLIVPATCAVLLTLCFMFIAKREVTVNTVAELTPTHAPLSIQATTSAPIVSNRLQEGKFVRKGTILIVYHDTQIQAEQHLLNAQRYQLRAKLKALQLLHASIATNTDQFKTDDQFGLHQQFKNYYTQRKINSLEKLRRNNSNLQLNTINTEQQALQSSALREVQEQSNSVQDQMNTAATKHKELQDTVRNYQIKAPSSGILHIDSNLAGKRRIAVGTQLAKVLPRIAAQQNAKIILYVLPTAITSIHTGQSIRFKLTRNIPVPIIMCARVVNIDSEPTVTKSGNMFKVVATVQLTTDLARQLHYGMQGQASIITGKKTYWRYITDQLFARE